MNRKFLSILLLCVLMALPATSQQPETWNKELKELRKVHPWAGRKVAYLGDSVMDPNNQAARQHLWSYLQQWLGITPLVYAVSGNQWSDIPAQASRLLAQHGQDFDAIIVFVGTNDYNSGTPIGQWYSETRCEVEAAQGLPRRKTVRMRRLPAMTSETYRGRINIALSDLKKKFPTRQIVLLTPIHRAFAEFGQNNLQPDETYTNDCGEYISSYVNAVKEAGNVWAVPVLDLNATCGLFPLFQEYTQYFNNPRTDRLHPNDAGHRRMALTLLYQLMSLPCTF